MADTDNTATLGNVRETLMQAIAELEAINVTFPAPLHLVVLLLGYDAVDDDRRKP